MAGLIYTTTPSQVNAHTHQTCLITARLFCVLEINKAESRERGWLSDKLDSGC